MAKSYRHLAYTQRCQIYTLKERGDSLAQIARVLKIHRSTVTRELKRNGKAQNYVMSRLIKELEGVGSNLTVLK